MEQTFFSNTNRRVIIGSPTKQATTGRICVPIRMPLASDNLASAPDWIDECYKAVSTCAKSMTPEIEQIAGITIAFANDKPSGRLFEDPSAKVPAAELRAFCAQRCGEEDDPDVELVFKLYVSFTRDFWRWLGEMAGKEVYMGFPSSLGVKVKAVPQSEKLPLDGGATDEEKKILAGDTKPAPGSAKYEDGVRKSMGVPKNMTRLERSDPPRGKSGLKELAAFHKQQAARETRKGAPVH